MSRIRWEKMGLMITISTSEWLSGGISDIWMKELSRKLFCSSSRLTPRMKVATATIWSSTSATTALSCCTVELKLSMISAWLLMPAVRLSTPSLSSGSARRTSKFLMRPWRLKMYSCSGNLAEGMEGTRVKARSIAGTLLPWGSITRQKSLAVKKEKASCSMSCHSDSNSSSRQYTIAAKQSWSLAVGTGSSGTSPSSMAARISSSETSTSISGSSVSSGPRSQMSSGMVGGGGSFGIGSGNLARFLPRFLAASLAASSAAANFSA
mmetsp:Transcript_28328/g.79971  ORF Transcript_28328/g.79971 Transcript_28328/m.79971 type:complete len:266 (-) Transcript_28328:438-1235(-)